MCEREAKVYMSKTENGEKKKKTRERKKRGER